MLCSLKFLYKFGITVREGCGAWEPFVYIFFTLFIVVIQYHDRKHVFHIVPQNTDVGVRV